MTKVALWAFLAIPLLPLACSDQSPTPEDAPISIPATATPSSLTPTPANSASPLPQGTTESRAAAETPTPAPPKTTSTPVLTEESPTGGLTPTAQPAITLTIIVAPIPGDILEYNRSDWKHWTDEDGDCQDARQEALIAESLVEVSFESERKCRVTVGRWYGAFTGTFVEVPGDLDIDHLVPLKNAHESGGWTWSSAKKEKYANYLGDPDHLIAVTKGANRSKGAKGPEEWRPPDEGYWCQYATDWAEVKMEWGLTMTQAETEAVIEMLDTCEEPVQVEATRADSASNTGGSQQPGTEEATATPTLEPEPESPGDISVYGSCEEAVEAGETRVQGSAGGGRGFPKEMVPSARDGDGDGVVCER